MKTAWQLHLIALMVVTFTLAAEGLYLFAGAAVAIPDVLLGRILGTFDTSLALVLAYYFSASLRTGPARSEDKPPEVK